MVRIGPSSVNKQPLRIDVDGNQCHLYDYINSKTTYKNRSLDMGIAAYHLEKTLEEEGFTGLFDNLKPTIKDMPEGMYYYSSFVVNQ